MRPRNGGCARKCAAPSPPKAPPSVERKTIAVRRGHLRGCLGLRLRIGARELDQRRRAARVVVRARPGPMSSRCAITTIVSGGRSAARRHDGDVRAGARAEPRHALPSTTTSCEPEPVDPTGSWLSNQLGADRADAARGAVRIAGREVAGERERRARCRTSPAAPASRAAPASSTVNASRSSGSSTTSSDAAVEAAVDGPRRASRGEAAGGADAREGTVGAAMRRL